jgi:hypothetical protein
VDVALKIWGPSVALLKGKTVHCKAPVVIQDIVEVPKEIRQHHKRVMLSIDIFIINGIPYFATLSWRICFLLVTHLNNQGLKGNAQLLPPEGFSDRVCEGRW